MVDGFSIKILEVDGNRKGDLFNRLMQDLFLSLGFEQFRSNIHKSGREIDIEAVHRIEQRRVVAECKASQEKIGGADINKFFGSYFVEKSKTPDVDTVGYFISLSGFKESAIEQENSFKKQRLILLDGEQVINELIKGNVIIPPLIAAETAGRYASKQSTNLKLDLKFDLLAHEFGWIWAFYFTIDKERTHVILIHADGAALSANLATAVIESDKASGGNLHKMFYLVNKKGVVNDEITKEKYFNYLIQECGDIHLEGLPADQEVGSRKINLENIYVPLHLDELKTITSEEVQEERILKTRIPVGELLQTNQRLAILAKPGGGKSTLLKRLAVAYASPNRRESAEDKLPKTNWFPIFIRCRQLVDEVKLSIKEIIDSSPLTVLDIEKTRMFLYRGS